MHEEYWNVKMCDTDLEINDCGKSEMEKLEVVFVGSSYLWK